MDEKRILAYSKIIWPEDLFLITKKRTKEDGSKNKFYYTNIINNWFDQRELQLKENSNLRPRQDLLLWYLKLLNSFIKGAYLLLVSVHDHVEQKPSNNILDLKESRVFDILKTLGKYEENIKHNINSGEYEFALNIQGYCLLMLDDAVDVLANQLCVKISDSPIQLEVDKIKNVILKSIDLERIKLLNHLKVNNPDLDHNPQRSIKSVIDPLPENPFEYIFKDNIGYQIFKKLHAHYKVQLGVFVANYSFMYHALLKDGYIICNGPAWIEFLSTNYDVQIDRIDSRQSGKNTRIPFYNSIKSQFQAQ